MDMKDLERLGEQVREALDAEAPSAPSEEQRMVLLESAARLAQRPARRSWFVPALATVAVVLCVGGFGWALGSGWLTEEIPTPPPTPEVLAERTTHWIEARGEQPEALRLDDGTVLTFSPRSRGRVEVTPGVTVRTTLETGELDASVRKGQPNSWHFLAGPFHVEVIGTEFTIRWEASSGQFNLDVREGQVLVTGGPIGGPGMPVSAGQRLRASVGDAAVELGPLAAAEPLVEPSAAGVEEPVDAPTEAPAGAVEGPAPARPHAPPTPRPHAVERVAVPSPAPTPASTPPPTVEAPPQVEAPRATWKQAAEAGRHAEALRLARAEGFERLIERLPASDLLLLADCARLGGDPGAARLALTGLRRRFPSADSASGAAFRLGRLSGTPSEQARWFRTYLAEAPSGALASEARGRLVQSLHQSGDAAGARKEARTYLDRHPSGPYAAFARSVLDRDEP